MALNASGLLLFSVAATEVLATVETKGIVRTATLFSGPYMLVQHGLWELAVLVCATTVAAPLAVMAASVYVLAGLRMPHAPPGLRQAFAWSNRLRPWSMIEVFLVGYFVAFAKLTAIVQMTPGPAFVALFGLMVTMCAADAFLDRESVWEAIAERSPPAVSTGRIAAPASAIGPGLISCHNCHLACSAGGGGARCPRCRARLTFRKANSVARAAALAISGVVLYVPANVFPALTVVRFGRGGTSTILSGVWELLAVGQVPLAAIVFVASVAIPVLKLLGLAAMLFAVLRRRIGHLRQLTMLYRVILAIGRWSMIDIFMESILAGLIQFGSVARIDPGSGALAFAAVVVLTMLATESFDPRLMWDGAER